MMKDSKRGENLQEFYETVYHWSLSSDNKLRYQKQKSLSVTHVLIKMYLAGRCYKTGL